jgi:uncharacterized membrane protein YcaP (DUF421 family)
MRLSAGAAGNPDGGDGRAMLHLGQHGSLVHELLVVFARTVALYVLALVVLRLAGKRTVGKMDVFDFVVAVTLGSAVAIGMEADNKLLPSLLPVVMLGGLQWLLSRVSLASPMVEGLARGRSVTLVRDGKPDRGALAAEHVTLGDLWMELRQKGFERLEDVREARLEATGKVSVLPSTPARPLAHADLERIARAVADEWERRQTRRGGQGSAKDDEKHPRG